MVLPPRMYLFKRMDNKLVVSSYRGLNSLHIPLVALCLYKTGMGLYAPWLLSRMNSRGALKKLVARGNKQKKSLPLYIYEDDPILCDVTAPQEVILER